MHELSIAKDIVDTAVTTAHEHDADRVDSLTLAVGRATHLNPDQLRFCVETVATNTPAHGATVTVETVEPRARCDCGWTGEPDVLDVPLTYVPDPICPDCGDRVELIEGRGCRLTRIEIPDDPAPRADTPSHP